MKSTSQGTSSSRMRSAMNRTAPLSTPTSDQIAIGVVAADLGAELADPALELVGLDQDLADRGVASPRSRTYASCTRARGAVSTATRSASGSSRKSSETATPATQAISPPTVTTGSERRNERGTPRSVNRSPSVFVPLIPSGRIRSPSRQVRTSTGPPQAAASSVARSGPAGLTGPG